MSGLTAMSGSTAMSGAELYALLPFITLSLVICVVLLTIAFWRNLKLTATLSVGGLFLTLAAISLVLGDSVQVTPLIRVDTYGLVFCGLIALSGIAVSLLAYDYLATSGELSDEFFVLMLSSALGGMILSCSTHFASFLLGLELLGVSLYAMISYPGKGELSLEAALKYLILSGVSSAFLLFGIALVFAITGSLDFGGLAKVTITGANQLLVFAGTAMMLAGILFKLSLVPFHMWTPDVYEGAPVPVTAFVATVSKSAIFAVLFRFLVGSDFIELEGVILGLTIVAILSMTIGNLLALLQNNVKRVLAYSSIAHLGYVLVALVSGGSHANLAIESASFFLIAYSITTLGAFGVVSVLSDGKSFKDAGDLGDFRGLFWRRPGLALTFSAMLLSLAGIPLTVGFVGKFYLFLAGVQAELWALVWTLIIGSGIGLYYYLRIIFAMTERTEGEEAEYGSKSASVWTIASLTLMLVTIGVYPAPLMKIVVAMIGSLVTLA